MVLVAPHDEDTLLLAGLFSTAGYALSTLFDTETAIEMCTAAMPDHVIVDLDTPKLDALLLVTKLRERVGGDRVRIVAIASVSATRHASDALFAAGYDVEVARPATVTKLIDALSAPSRRR